MDEKKFGVAPQEMVEELDEASLSQISGGVTSYVGGIAQRSLTSHTSKTCHTPNMNNIANSADVIGQKKYTIDRIAGSVYATAPARTDEQ